MGRSYYKFFAKSFLGGGEDSRIADRDIQRGGGWKERTAAADKTTTSPHSCTSHRRAAAHRRAGGKRALRLLIFRFWVDFEEIYLYFGPPRGPAPRISPSAVTAGHEAAFHIGAPHGVRGPDGACWPRLQL